MIRSHSASVVRSSAALSATPALLTSTSTGPTDASTASVAARSMRSRRSATPPISRAIASRSGCVRPHTIDPRAGPGERARDRRADAAAAAGDQRELAGEDSVHGPVLYPAPGGGTALGPIKRRRGHGAGPCPCRSTRARSAELFADVRDHLGVARALDDLGQLRRVARRPDPRAHARARRAARCAA